MKERQLIFEINLLNYSTLYIESDTNIKDIFDLWGLIDNLRAKNKLFQARTFNPGHIIIINPDYIVSFRALWSTELELKEKIHEF